MYEHEFKMKRCLRPVFLPIQGFQTASQEMRELKTI
jgi:hypothetical protein